MKWMEIAESYDKQQRWLPVVFHAEKPLYEQNNFASRLAVCMSLETANLSCQGTSKALLSPSANTTRPAVLTSQPVKGTCEGGKRTRLSPGLRPRRMRKVYLQGDVQAPKAYVGLYVPDRLRMTYSLCCSMTPPLPRVGYIQGGCICRHHFQYAKTRQRYYLKFIIEKIQMPNRQGAFQFKVLYKFHSA